MGRETLPGQFYDINCEKQESASKTKTELKRAQLIVKPLQAKFKSRILLFQHRQKFIWALYSCNQNLRVGSQKKKGRVRMSNFQTLEEFHKNKKERLHTMSKQLSNLGWSTTQTPHITRMHKHTSPYYHLSAYITRNIITSKVATVNKLFRIAISIVLSLWWGIFLSLVASSSIWSPLSLTLSGYWLIHLSNQIKCPHPLPPYDNT